MANYKHVMTNCVLYINGVPLEGVVSEIEIPTAEVKVEEQRNAGQVMPVEYGVGYEKLNMTFKAPNLTPELFLFFDLQLGGLANFMATASTKDEDGTVHSWVCFMRGFVKKAGMGTLKPGENADAEFEVCVHSYDLHHDGAPIISMSPTDVSVGGVSQTAAERRALLLI